MTTSELGTTETASIDGHQAKFVDVDGVTTRYYEVGEGPPMVMWHGGYMNMSNANTWSRNLAGLGQHFRVFAADRIGCGMTDNPKSDDDYTMDATIAHAVAFVRTMGLEGVRMVGQSVGGYVAARSTLELGDLVKTLVVVDSATLAPEVGDYAERRGRTLNEGPSDPKEALRHRYTRMSFHPEHINDAFLDSTLFLQGLPKAKEAAERLEAGGSKRFQESVVRQKEETHRWIRDGRLTQPTLLHWGRNDPTAILPQGHVLFDMISETNPLTRMVILNQAGHFHYREYPDEFNHNVVSFVSRWAPTEAAS